jgi:hypothetical protein
MRNEKVDPAAGEVQSTSLSPFSPSFIINTLSFISSVLYPRNDSRTGGAIGPTVSQDLSLRAIDVGTPMMGMHSIRAITGSKDPGLAIKLLEGFFELHPEIISMVDNLL